MVHPRFARLCAAIGALELPIVVAIAPALLFPTPARLTVLLAVPLVWCCVYLSGGRPVPRTPLNAAVWVMLSMACVSLFATFDVRTSLGKVSGLVLGTLLFWAVVRWTANSERLRLLTVGYIVAGAGLAVLGLLGTNWFDKFPLLGSVIARLPRAIRGVPGAADGFHPNAVAGCLVLFVPLQVVLLLSGPGRRGVLPSDARRPRWPAGLVQLLLLALTAGTLVLTQSRGAWVGMAVAGGVFLGVYSRRTRALAAVLALAMVSVSVWLGPARMADLAISRSGPGMADDVSGRVELWSRAILGIQDFPLTGMGMNAFRTVMPAAYPTFLTSPDYDVAHAHNHLLQAALDLGVPGLVAYAALWLGAIHLLASVYRRGRQTGPAAVAGGLALGLVAHFTFSMTDAIPLGAKAGVFFWLSLALAAALHGRAFDERPRHSPL